jgi:hypothetical protein
MPAVIVETKEENKDDDTNKDKVVFKIQKQGDTLLAQARPQPPHKA